MALVSRPRWAGALVCHSEPHLQTQSFGDTCFYDLLMAFLSVSCSPLLFSIFFYFSSLTSTFFSHSPFFYPSLPFSLYPESKVRFGVYFRVLISLRRNDCLYRNTNLRVSYILPYYLSFQDLSFILCVHMWGEVYMHVTTNAHGVQMTASGPSGTEVTGGSWHGAENPTQVYLKSSTCS